MTDMLTTDELIEHIRTALGGVGPQQVKRVLKAVGVLAHREAAALARAEAAEAEAAEARATNEALAELAASETERRVALADWLTASRRFMKAHRHCRPQTVQPAAVEVGVSEFVQPAPEAQ